MSGPLGPLLLKSHRVWGWFTYSKNFSRATFFVFWGTHLVDRYLSYLPVKQIWRKSAVWYYSTFRKLEVRKKSNRENLSNGQVEDFGRFIATTKKYICTVLVGVVARQWWQREIRINFIPASLRLDRRRTFFPGLLLMRWSLDVKLLKAWILGAKVAQACPLDI